MRTSTESNHSTARETSAPQAVGSVTSGQRALRSLPEFRAKGAEVIVVDGGSSDDTLTRARPLADQVLASPQGRAPDESGSKLCNWDILLFLHANTHQKG